MSLAKSIKKVTNGTEKFYKKTARYTGNKANGLIMRPLTKTTQITLKKIPLVGNTLSYTAGVPRQLLRAGTNVVVYLPNAAKKVASVGGNVITRTIMDPILAFGLKGQASKARRITKKSSKKPSKKPNTRFVQKM